MIDKSIMLILFNLREGNLRNEDLISLEKKLKRYFKYTMPNKFWIFPQNPDVYTISNTVCITLPSWGSSDYRYDLYDLEMALVDRFECDVTLYDGKTTFVIRGIRNEEV